MDVKFVMFKTDGRRKDFPLTEAKTVIGRAKSCQLRIPLTSISRRHCEVTLFEDILGIRDLSSTNGTYVNNERVTDFELDAGDRVVVGPVVFTVQIDGIPEEIEPVVSEALQAAESGQEGEENIVELDDVVTAGGSAEEEDDSSGTTPGTIEVELDDAAEDPAQGGEDSFASLESMTIELDEDQDPDEKQK